MRFILKFVGYIFVLFVNNVFAYSVDWEIGNRFRSFDYIANNDTNKSKELFDEYAPTIGDGVKGDGVNISDWMSERIIARKSPLSPFSKTKRGPWSEEGSKVSPTSGYDKNFVKLPSNLYVTIQLKGDALENIPDGICDVYLNANSQDKKVFSDSCSKKIVINDYPSSGGRLRFESKGIAFFETDEIKPKLRIILGFGDSYGAGEGAPDIPTVWKKNIYQKSWTLGKENLPLIDKFAQKSAEWYSDKCNRSYFSAQSLTALKLARKNPHEVVSFAHFACAGAEVVDGILAPQRNAPGSDSSNCSKKDIKDIKSPRPECDVHYSQISSAVNLLCDKNKTVSADKQKILSKLVGIKTNKYQIEDNWINDLKACSVDSALIKPDLILLQIGGNDIGFGSIIAWGLIPVKARGPLGGLALGLARNKGRVVCPDKSSAYCVKDTLTADERMEDLPKRYQALNEAFKEILKVDEKSVVISGYTNPLYAENGKLCSNTANVLNPNEWWLMKTLIPVGVVPKKWQINLTNYEADEVNSKVVPNLNRYVFENKIDNPWKFADTSSVMDGHGWCVDLDKKQSSFTLPRPKDLSKWTGTSYRGRYIGTANDSLMTQWRGWDKNDFIGGTFHPNIHGYAAMADELYNASKDVIKP